MKYILFVVLLLAMFITIPASFSTAQEAPPWEVVLVTEDGTGLYIVTRNQVEYFGLPEEFTMSKGTTISSDGNYVLYPSWYYHLPRLGDLSASDCCIFIEPPVESIEEVMEFRAGVFSPDGTFFTGTFVINTGGTKQRPSPTTYLVIGESATGQITEYIEIPDEHPIRVPQAIAWAGDQIYLLPSCHACEPPLWGTYYVWERSRAEINETDLMFNLYYGDRLSIFGAFVVAERNTDYAYDPEEDYIFSPRNVITYYENGRQSDAPSVWYHNPAHLDLFVWGWVMGGQGYLFSDGHGEESEYFLGLRDGTVISLSASTDDLHFESTTLNGWLMSDFDGNLHLGSVQAGDLPIRWETLAEEFPVTELLLYTPNGTPMKNLLQEQLVDINCPVALSQRLTVGEQGQVTPGAANNLRAEPDNSSELLGQIPAGGEFMVIGGPICSGGLRYWQVDYQGTIGWTAEGEYDTYWLEPLSD